MKINAVFTYGASDDGSGAEEMVQAVNELCGVEYSQYAEIDFDGMKALVDAVGAVDMYVPEGDEVDDPEGPLSCDHRGGAAAHGRRGRAHLLPRAPSVCRRRLHPYAPPAHGFGRARR